MQYLKEKMKTQDYIHIYSVIVLECFNTTERWTKEPNKEELHMKWGWNEMGLPWICGRSDWRGSHEWGYHDIQEQRGEEPVQWVCKEALSETEKTTPDCRRENWVRLYLSPDGSTQPNLEIWVGLSLDYQTRMKFRSGSGLGLGCIDINLGIRLIYKYVGLFQKKKKTETFPEKNKNMLDWEDPIVLFIFIFFI